MPPTTDSGWALMSAAVTYVACGLNFTCDTPLRLPTAHDAPSDFALRIEIGGCAPAPAVERCAYVEPESDVVGVATADGFTLWLGPLIQVVVNHGAAVVRLDEGRAHLASVLCAAIVPALWATRRGEAVLHGSAASVASGDGLVFIGSRGAGKSLMVAACCAGGAALIADDIVRSRSAASRQWTGSASSVRLRPDTLEVFADVFSDAPTTRTADGRVAVACTPARSAGVLRAAIVPRFRSDGPPTPPVVSRVANAEAVGVYAASQRFPHWTSAEGRRTVFSHAVDLATTLPMFTADIHVASLRQPNLADSLLEAIASS